MMASVPHRPRRRSQDEALQDAAALARVRHLGWNEAESRRASSAMPAMGEDLMRR